MRPEDVRVWVRISLRAVFVKITKAEKLEKKAKYLRNPFKSLKQ
jgi:hypothetical protein